MKKTLIQIAMLTAISTLPSLAKDKSQALVFPQNIKIENIALNPEGIEYNKNNHSFLLSSLNALPILQVNLDGSHKAFTSGEKFPLSTAGLHIDYKHNKLLVAGFNGMELMDKDPKTKGTSHLRIYNLTTGIIEKDIDLSSLAPKASAYFANDLTVDNEGNIYISDWYANLIYKVDTQGKASIFWENTSGIMAGPNGLDFHPDGYLLVSLIKVNDKGIYNKHGLIKIPLNNPKSATVVKITSPQFFGFDGMVIDTKGNVTGITNNQTSAGGNMLIELTSTNAWKSAQVTQAKAIKSSTTLAQTPNNKNYVINQDFKDNFAKTWTIQNIAF